PVVRIIWMPILLFSVSLCLCGSNLIAPLPRLSAQPDFSYLSSTSLKPEKSSRSDSRSSINSEDDYRSSFSWIHEASHAKDLALWISWFGQRRFDCRLRTVRRLPQCVQRRMLPGDPAEK